MIEQYFGVASGTLIDVTDAQWRRAFELFEAVSELSQSAAEARLADIVEEQAVVLEVRKLLETAPAEAFEIGPVHRFTGLTVGRYEVSGFLGAGSSGEVYSGRDQDLGRRVALKFLSLEPGAAAPVRSFLREAQALSALNHPNIVTVHEVITWNAIPVIVMELVDGKSLRAICNQLLSLREATGIACQILEALSCAHAQGIVHRDLKPENVMVRPDGYTKVLDFGLARGSFLDQTPADSSATNGLPVGTLRYMSPEQCRGELATPASDVFAAGIVLYEMYAGRHPFAADSPLDTAHAIAWEQPRAPSQWNSRIPGSLDSLILRMLGKDPAARPSATKATLALAELRTKDSSKFNLPRRYAAALLAILFTLGSAAALLWIHNRERAVFGNPVSNANFEIVRVAGMLGQQRMPSLSPDGTKVAFEFVSSGSSTPHIYIKELAAVSPAALTRGNWPDTQPSFSPDGTKVAFLRQDQQGFHVMVVPASGGKEARIADVSDLAPGLRRLAWLPSGTNLVVADGLGRRDAQTALFAIPLSGAPRRQLTFPDPPELDYIPDVSPDGRTLGFARIDGGTVGRIWTMPVPDTKTTASDNLPRPLTGIPHPIASWDWTADGQSVLISRVQGIRTSLWRQPLNGGPETRVTGIDDQVNQLSISRVGTHLVYAPLVYGNTSIWLHGISLAHDAPRRLISSDLADVDMRYSPDGRSIAFASLRSGEMRVWVCANDGSNVRAITPFEEGHGWAAGSPNWSPDGKRIAFDAGGDAQTRHIYIVDILGGPPRRITGPGPSNDQVPAWSADGLSIFFNSNLEGQQDIWRVPITGGVPTRVTHNHGFESASTPDGRFLYYSTAYKPGLWRLSLISGDTQAIPALSPVDSRSWGASSKGIYYVSSNPSPVLSFFDYATETSRAIRPMPAKPEATYRGLSVSPDGQNLLYVQAEQGRSNLQLIKNFH